MKYMSVGFVILCTAAFLTAGCAMFSSGGTSSVLNNSQIFSSVPSEPVYSANSSFMSGISEANQIVHPAGLHLSLEIPLQPSRIQGVAAPSVDMNGNADLSADDASAVYDKATLTEDVNLRGNVLIKGYLVVAPQATLRVEPGAVIRFAATGTKNTAARLVIQGRIHAVGTADKPIVFTSDRSTPARGDWGGISLVASEKRNQLEHCRIEYANTGLETQFSTVSLKMVSVGWAHTGFLMRDSVTHINGGVFSNSDIGFEMHDSELDMKELTVSACKRGIVMFKSAASISSCKITNNEQFGLLSDECRIRITAVELSGNGYGADLKGGEGQIIATSFLNNREVALHLAGTRVKVNRCRFFDNNQDALRLEDGRALVWGNSFSGNKGFNLHNSGREDVNALQNWWGSSDPAAISQKIYDAVRDPRSGSVQHFPWLSEKPVFLQ